MYAFIYLFSSWVARGTRWWALEKILRSHTDREDHYYIESFWPAVTFSSAGLHEGAQRVSCTSMLSRLAQACSEAPLHLEGGLQSLSMIEWSVFINLLFFAFKVSCFVWHSLDQLLSHLISLLQTDWVQGYQQICFLIGVSKWKAQEMSRCLSALLVFYLHMVRAPVPPLWLTVWGSINARSFKLIYIVHYHTQKVLQCALQE